MEIVENFFICSLKEIQNKILDILKEIPSRNTSSKRISTGQGSDYLVNIRNRAHFKINVAFTIGRNDYQEIHQLEVNFHDQLFLKRNIVGGLVGDILDRVIVKNNVEKMFKFQKNNHCELFNHFHVFRVFVVKLKIGERSLDFVDNSGLEMVERVIINFVAIKFNTKRFSEVQNLLDFMHLFD